MDPERRDPTPLTEFESRRHLDYLSDADYLRCMAEHFADEQCHTYGWTRLNSIANFIDAVTKGDPHALVDVEVEAAKLDVKPIDKAIARTPLRMLRGGLA